MTSQLGIFLLWLTSLPNLPESQEASTLERKDHVYCKHNQDRLTKIFEVLIPSTPGLRGSTCMWHRLRCPASPTTLQSIPSLTLMSKGFKICILLATKQLKGPEQMSLKNSLLRPCR